MKKILLIVVFLACTCTQAMSIEDSLVNIPDNFNDSVLKADILLNQLLTFDCDSGYFLKPNNKVLKFTIPELQDIKEVDLSEIAPQFQEVNNAFVSIKYVGNCKAEEGKIYLYGVVYTMFTQAIPDASVVAE